ncbi:MAG: FGGY-family carbohydrate kinase [Planctomycetaceae bacterium]|jgi:xylulokinase|nr:FGGY-family carbohydrate kinase [Planctomycetaceae bacterium]
MIISYDLGTGGNKASLFDNDGSKIISVFEAYPTFYPAPNFHEQRPEDWMHAVVQSTRRLLREAKNRHITADDITALAISGHSLGCVPLDKNGSVLRDTTPIWSDRRSSKEAETFFQNVNADDWYSATGNGFPAAHYTLFKVLWYKNNEPAIFAETDKIIGTKDYINYRLTGKIAADYSYASGLGAYRLTEWQYDEDWIRLAGLPPELFPKIVPSTQIIGTLTPPAADELGLSPKTAVAAGGVDNSCMALGAGCFQDGQLYASLGSSSWIAVADSKPLLDVRLKPYVFTHVVPQQFASALALFSSGTSLRWIRDQLCRDLCGRAEKEGVDVYDLMIAEAETSVSGANGVLFNPTLGGGSALDPGPNIRGAFLALDLSHTRGDLIRAAMEGIAMNLRLVLDAVRKLTAVQKRMNVVGGGAISPLWRQIYADALQIEIAKTNIGQDAAALGAAALAAVGTGIWTDFANIARVLQTEDVKVPQTDYSHRLAQFSRDAAYLAERG